MLTVANAAKPLTVDDPAYLAYARQIARDPLDPYGFTIFWYDAPQPAFEVLAPPALPYWLAAGLRLFGEDVVLLKLWLFPVALLLAASAWSLARRFARGFEAELAVMAVLSPTVLPGFNLMLDVPALALALASVVLFLRACDRGSWSWAVVAGVVSGVAMQTKYTAATAPVVMALYALGRAGGVSTLMTGQRPRRRDPSGGLRPPLALLAALAAATLVFAGWEAFTAARYGESHFLHHLRDPHGHHRRDAGVPVALVTLLGGLAVPVAAVTLAVRAPVAGVILAALLPACLACWDHAQAQGADRWAAPAFAAYGLVVIGTTAACARRAARSPAGRFLAGWLAVEVAAYFVLSPFPAARRLTGVCFVLTVLALREASRRARPRPGLRAVTRQAVALSVALAGMYAATDWLDAVVERKLAESSVALAGRGGARVWFVGHAGFGYYAGRAGAAPVAPGDRLEEDDRVIVPVDWPVAQAIDWPDDALERVGQSPPLPERRRHTLPTYYAGKVPVEHRDAGRAAVVYRVRAAFVARPRPR